MTDQQVTIELVTSPGCRNCTAVRSMIQRVLDEFDAAFTEIDLTDHPEYAHEYQLCSAPAVIIDGQLAFQGRVSEEAFRRQFTTIHPREST